MNLCLLYPHRIIYNSTILLLDEKTNFFSTDNIRTYVFPLLETLLFSTLTRKSPGYTETVKKEKGENKGREIIMAFDFQIFGDRRLKEDFVQWLIEERWPENYAHFLRLWDYYQNPTQPIGATARISESARTYMQAQEVGLPSRITGIIYSAASGPEAGEKLRDIQRKEIVIENDIAWRINVMVDFLFGKGIKILSRASDPQRRGEIEQILRAVIEANGGAGFYQDMAVLGSVYGFVDCMIRPGSAVISRFAGQSPVPSHPLTPDSLQHILQQAATIDLELIEAPRALPILDENDYRKVQYYVQHFYQPQNEISQQDNFVMRLVRGKGLSVRRKTAAITEVIGPTVWQRYENFELVQQSVNPLGFVSVVHIQNMAQPYFYEGLSDVEQLLGLQDELNTRLSDRASRITFQSFKMYLIKGLEGMQDKPVAPGRMWCTDNLDATIEEFGGDGASPSENLHIAEVREAMDKISGVTPVVAGVLKNKIGNLTSGVALKMTFMGMLTKTARKQFCYGQGLKRLGQMILEILDRAGLYPTQPEDRQLDIVFPNPLPEDEMEKLQQAKLKSELGIPTEKVLKELGYNTE